MAIKIVVPELGESVLEATVSRWLKKQGDFVKVGDVIVELETDKVNLEVGAKGSGVLQKIEVSEGTDVKVGDVLGTIDEKAEEPKASAPEPEPAAAETKEAEKEKETVSAASGKDGREMQRQTAPQVTPVASRLARANDVDISKLSGTGSEGRVTKADVELFLQGQEKAKENEKQPQTGAEREAQPVESAIVTPSASAQRREERMRMSRRRRTIAQRLLEAKQNTAMLTTFNEIDMGAVMDLRSRRNEEFQKRFGIKLGFTSFFVKASVSALKAFPQINAEIDGEEIVLKRYYDIGMAVGSAEGLVVPVIRDADKLSFAEIEKQVKDFVAKTDQGKLSIEDLRGGTFTITNGGVFGSLLSTPILNPPQVGILGLHKIEERPIAQNGQIVIRPMMYVALSYDHRIVDGREAVQFLVHIKQLLEDPAWMLVEG
ncbi:MAG: 2-oxoglutarate dehydrogenase complex dihydrolipoyllysine-residue succinyltransferase [Anaerolineae bacterium]|nr:2-oxoglutarate dehydrogenase complex dihydrolipoyllysine-residue succinyltransferase [Anaerolineae bacterium]MCI0608061.1 2-oxoglutarate dehydrogenase complex dihydrolipoyllysine-residue succinyltransferase [Anaerolineae bacterium]